MKYIIYAILLSNIMYAQNQSEKIILNKILSTLNNTDVLAEDSVEKKEILENRKLYTQIVVTDYQNLQKKWSKTMSDYATVNIFELMNQTAFSCIQYFISNDDRLLYTKIALSALSFVHFCRYMIQIKKTEEKLKKINQKIDTDIRLLHLLESYE